jgi:hypothetical protein
MENKIFVTSIKNQFSIHFSMIEKIIEVCPDELWNKKASGFVFWQQLVHTFGGINDWLRDEKPEINSFSEINGKKIYPCLMEKDPEIVLTKKDVMECCNETKKTVEKWFAGKDDDWLKSPYKIYSKITNFDQTNSQIKQLMYHIGHCEAIFRENGIKTGDFWTMMDKDGLLI